MAEALNYVHRQDFIHRDVCPRNFICTPDAVSLKLIEGADNFQLLAVPFFFLRANMKARSRDNKEPPTLNAVKNIAVAASLGQMFRGVKLCEEFTARDLWTHCMAVAVTSRELAKQMKLPIADEAFLAGMIHDLGLLVSLLWQK